VLHPLVFPTGNDLFAGGGLKLPQTAHVSVHGRALLYAFSARPILRPHAAAGAGKIVRKFLNTNDAKENRNKNEPPWRQEKEPRAFKKVTLAFQRRVLLSVHCNSSIRLDSPAAGASAVPALKHMLVAQFFA
jgi:hypothetical protein